MVGVFDRDVEADFEDDTAGLIDGDIAGILDGCNVVSVGVRCR